MAKPDDRPETLRAPPGWAPPEAETLPELQDPPSEPPEPECRYPQPPGARRSPEAKGGAGRPVRAHRCRAERKSRPIESFYFAVNGVPRTFGEMSPEDQANAQTVPCLVERCVTEAELPPGGEVVAVRMRLGPFVHPVLPWAEDSCGAWSYVVEDGRVVVHPELPEGAELEVEVA